MSDILRKNNLSATLRESERGEAGKPTGDKTS